MLPPQVENRWKSQADKTETPARGGRLSHFADVPSYHGLPDMKNHVGKPFFLICRLFRFEFDGKVRYITAEKGVLWRKKQPISYSGKYLFRTAA